MENIKFVDSSLNHEQETLRRIMLLHPCDTCTRVSAYSPSHRYHCYEYCPAFKSWAKTSWYWISRRIKKSAAEGTISATAQTRTSHSRLAVIH